MSKVTVQISAPLFAGFRVVFDEEEYDAAGDEEVLAKVKLALLRYLSSENLQDLVSRAKTLELHLDRCCGSNPGYRDRKSRKFPKTVYACDHEHKMFRDEESA